MKTILIIQSIPAWVPILINSISEKFPGLAYCVYCTDSFDHAIDLIQKEGELIVVTSEMFHDDLSDHKKDVTQKIPDYLKNGDKLAEMIKVINPKAKVYIFSEYEPKNNENIDGFVKKDEFNVNQSLLNFLKIFE